MEVISVILMFVFGNMNDQATQMTQYIPMKSLSSCMKEVRLLKKKNTGYGKDAFCIPSIVEIKNDEVIETIFFEFGLVNETYVSTIFPSLLTSIL